MLKCVLSAAALLFLAAAPASAQVFPAVEITESYPETYTHNGVTYLGYRVNGTVTLPAPPGPNSTWRVMVLVDGDNAAGWSGLDCIFGPIGWNGVTNPGYWTVLIKAAPNGGAKAPFMNFPEGWWSLTAYLSYSENQLVWTDEWWALVVWEQPMPFTSQVK
jgi:hypothetical protein